ncbi:DJ-1/PfpI family protein [Nocardioides sp.]|uniref:DJ-1/PfpI family protein n=1 Tax=Nocardioides sp. TaxID=35761 RepID=UPI00356B189C
MQIAIVLFEHCTALDAVGPYEVLSRVPDATVHMTGAGRTVVRTDTGRLGLQVDTTYAEIPEPDIVVVPGGFGQRVHREGSELHEWLLEADRRTTWTTSVCTGSLVLASAGLLAGRRATSHWLARADLAEYGALPSDERVVVDGKYVTAAGVSAGMDMALTLVARACGVELAQTIQLGIEYDPQPPYETGSPDRVPGWAVELLTSARSLFV